MSGNEYIDGEELELRAGVGDSNFDAWYDKLGPFGDRKCAAGQAGYQPWKFSNRIVDTIQVREFSTGKEEIVRRPHHLRRTFSECVAIHINITGVRHVVVGDDVLCTQPGEIYFHNLNLPTRYFTAGNLHTLAVFIPYSAIGYDPSRHPTSQSVPMSSPVGQMLLTALRSAHAESGRMRRAEAPAVAAGFCGLVKGLMIPGATDEQCADHVQTARAGLIKSYIEDHLLDPGLNTNRLCQEFAISRATVYRLFAEDGGVTRYVNDRRLCLAFRQLRSSPATRGKIKAVAEALGFDDHSHFHRSFRKKFQLNPSDALGMWVDRTPASNSREPA